MTKLSPEAEALREAIRSAFPNVLGLDIPVMARTIVEELGITEECDPHCGLGRDAMCDQCRNRLAAASTLLELAGVNHGK